jgi:hypothetical protein
MGCNFYDQTSGKERQILYLFSKYQFLKKDSVSWGCFHTPINGNNNMNLLNMPC